MHLQPFCAVSFQWSFALKGVKKMQCRRRYCHTKIVLARTGIPKGRKEIVDLSCTTWQQHLVSVQIPYKNSITLNHLLLVRSIASNLEATARDCSKRGSVDSEAKTLAGLERVTTAAHTISAEPVPGEPVSPSAVFSDRRSLRKLT